MATFDSAFFFFQFTVSIAYPPINNDNKIKFVAHLHNSFPFIFQKMTELVRDGPRLEQPVTKVKMFLQFNRFTLHYTPVLQQSAGNVKLAQLALSFADADLLMTTYDQTMEQLASVESVQFTRTKKRGNHNDDRIQRFHSPDNLFEISLFDVAEDDVLHQIVISSFRDSVLQLAEDLQIYSMKQVKSKYKLSSFPCKAALKKVALHVTTERTAILRSTIIIEDLVDEVFEFKPTLLSTRENIGVPVASRVVIPTVRDEH
jgi:hypothetical protein